MASASGRQVRRAVNIWLALLITFAVLVLSSAATRSATAAAPTRSPTRAANRTPTPGGTPSSTPRPTEESTLLPSALCALVGSQVVCYDARLSQATPVTPPDQRVSDFAIAPDGNWLAYRAAEALYLTPLTGPAPLLIDPQAAPPADLQPDRVTLTWSPDGIGIAYVTVGGLRVAYPGGHVFDGLDRPYVNLKWSPGGGHLAAQSADGDWSFFEAKRDTPLRQTRVFAQAADATWLAEDAVIVAPVAGGLLRIDPGNASAPPAWYVADEHFIKLQTTASGQIVALHPDPGDVIGNSVTISADGKWTPLGTAKLDSRLEWGPPSGEWLLYITSGTPILVDRVTGLEDMIPIRRVSRIIWGPAPLPVALGVALDADLYFLSPDENGIIQLWRLPRSGFPLIQLSQSSVSLNEYTVFPDSIRYVAGGFALSVSLDGLGLLPAIATADASPNPTRPPNTPVPPAGTIQNVGWQPGPLAIQRLLKTGEASSAYLLEGAILSPTGKFAVGFRGSPTRRLLAILDWTTGRIVTIQGIHAATDLRWIQ